MVCAAVIGGISGLAAHLLFPVLAAWRGFAAVNGAVATIVVFIAMGWITHRRLLARLRKARAKLTMGQVSDARAAVAEALRGTSKLAMQLGPIDVFTGHSVLDEAAWILLEHGQAGTTLRLSEQAPNTDHLTPLELQFEPVPLGAKPPELADDGGATAKQPNAWQRICSEEARLYGRSLAARIFLAASLILLVVSLVYIVIDAVTRLAAGTMPSIFASMATAALVVGVLSLLKLAFPRQWLVVPGGIIVRTATWRSAEWKLRVFRREECVLLHWADTNMLAVGSTNGAHFTHRAAIHVADFAIRAWLSPLEPPAVERLSDLE